MAGATERATSTKEWRMTSRGEERKSWLDRQHTPADERKARRLAHGTEMAARQAAFDFPLTLVTAQPCLHVAGGAPVALVQNGRTLCAACTPARRRRQSKRTYSPTELRAFRSVIARVFGEVR